jgi:YbgC/YbaW family acyl-CoA thioester hydrolase
VSETPSIETTHPVMFFDTDCAGVVHNLAYLRFIETARTLLAEQLGWKLAEMGQSGLYPVLVRTEIDYIRPAVLGDVVKVTGRLTQVQRARFWCAFEGIRASDSEILVKCRQQLAVVQMPQGRPVRLPADWNERFAHLRAPAD